MADLVDIMPMAGLAGLAFFFLLFLLFILFELMVGASLRTLGATLGMLDSEGKPDGKSDSEGNADGKADSDGRSDVEGVADGKADSDGKREMDGNTEIEGMADAVTVGDSLGTALGAGVGLAIADFIDFIPIGFFAGFAGVMPMPLPIAAKTGWAFFFLPFKSRRIVPDASTEIKLEARRKKVVKFMMDSLVFGGSFVRCCGVVVSNARKAV
jgi:hypothetical protein